MANMRVVLAQRNARLDALTTAIGTSGLIKLYTATQAANADTAIGAQLLCGTLTFSATAAPAASGGVLTFNTITQDAGADISNTATWARITTSGGTTVFDCDVTATGGGGSIQLNTNVLTTGGPIQITSFTITDPA